MNELALFAGAGGGILGGKILGWKTICAVEKDPYCIAVLAQRQNDGLLPSFPIWDDVCTFDGRPWRGYVDVVSGGFPCQDISAAGKGGGIEGDRSGLWVEMARIIGEVRPRFAFVENSPMLTARGLGKVLGDLAEMGFDARWGVISAADVGAPHLRERIWIVGDAYYKRKSISTQHDEAPKLPEVIANTKSVYAQRFDRGQRKIESRRSDWWEIEPKLGRVANGVPARVDRLKALGNGQVPQCAAEAWRVLSG